MDDRGVYTLTATESHSVISQGESEPVVSYLPGFVESFSPTDNKECANAPRRFSGPPRICMSLRVAGQSDNLIKLKGCKRYLACIIRYTSPSAPYHGYPAGSHVHPSREYMAFDIYLPARAGPNQVSTMTSPADPKHLLRQSPRPRRDRRYLPIAGFRGLLEVMRRRFDGPV
jgi:hypothetical protein